MSGEAHCANKALMNDWKEVTIATDGSVAITMQARENTLNHDTASHLADIAANGSTIVTT